MDGALREDMGRIIDEACDISPDLKGILKRMVEDAPDALEHAVKMRDLAYSFMRSQSFICILGALSAASVSLYKHLNLLDCAACAGWTMMSLSGMANVMLFACDAVATRRLLRMAERPNMQRARDVVGFHMHAARMFKTLTRTAHYQYPLLQAARIFSIGSSACLLISGVSGLVLTAMGKHW